jgi:hypothetical protein
MLADMRWREQARRFRREVSALYLPCRDPRTPWHAKALAMALVAYTFSPIDIIPDFVPVLGYLDGFLASRRHRDLRWSAARRPMAAVSAPAGSLPPSGGMSMCQPAISAGIASRPRLDPSARQRALPPLFAALAPEGDRRRVLRH